MTVVIKKIENSLPVAELNDLLTASAAEGFGMIQDLIDHWNDKSNTFSKPGEALFVVQDGSRIVGVGGRNIDPYLNDNKVARVRRLYILPRYRRRGVASKLLKEILNVPLGTFNRFTLCAENPAAHRLYERMGFAPTGEARTTHQLWLTREVEKISGNTHLIDHPLIQHKLAEMREKDTDTQDFRTLLREISMLMGYELLRDLPTEEAVIETPLEKMRARKLSGKKLCIVPILRAGLGFVDGLLALAPAMEVGHIGLYRDPNTLQAVEYYKKFPTDMANRCVIVVDPMLATGHSAAAAVDFIKAAGATDIRFLCLIAAPVGLKAFHDAHPDVHVYTAAIDRELNDHGYILPGIGDAGDRIFGTK